MILKQSCYVHALEVHTSNISVFTSCGLSKHTLSTSEGSLLSWNVKYPYTCEYNIYIF